MLMKMKLGLEVSTALGVSSIAPDAVPAATASANQGMIVAFMRFVFRASVLCPALLHLTPGQHTGAGRLGFPCRRHRLDALRLRRRQVVLFGAVRSDVVKLPRSGCPSPPASIARRAPPDCLRAPSKADAETRRHGDAETRRKAGRKLRPSSGLIFRALAARRDTSRPPRPGKWP